MQIKATPFQNLQKHWKSDKRSILLMISLQNELKVSAKLFREAFLRV